MDAVIYLRVSTEDQARRGYSLDGQEQSCRRRADELGAARVEVYRDAGISGSILERPGLQEALAAAAKAAWFIVYDPDRLSRKLAHQLFLVDQIEKDGCRLEFVNFDWQDTPEGRLFYSLRGAIAEYEREKFRLRSQFGKRAKAERGLLTHNPRLFGYRYGEGRLEIDGEQAVVYRYMVSQALLGKSPEEIAGQLNALGEPGPGGGPWYRATIRRLLKNPSYTGTMNLHRYDAGGVKTARQKGEKCSYRIRPGEEWIPVAIPPLITPEEWNNLQSLLARQRHGQRGRKVNVYLLSGLLYCACGGRMHGTTSNGRRYYACGRRRTAGPDYRRSPGQCDSPFLPADGIETALWRQVKEWLSDPGSMARAVRCERENRVRTQELDVLRVRVAALEREKERIFAAYRRGVISLDEFAEASLRVTAAAEAAGNRLREREDAAGAGRALLQGIEGLEAMAAEVIDRLDALEPDAKKHVLNGLVSRAVIRGQELTLEVRLP